MISHRPDCLSGSVTPRATTPVAGQQGKLIGVQSSYGFCTHTRIEPTATSQAHYRSPVRLTHQRTRKLQSNAPSPPYISGRVTTEPVGDSADARGVTISRENRPQTTSTHSLGKQQQLSVQVISCGSPPATGEPTAYYSTVPLQGNPGASRQFL